MFIEEAPNNRGGGCDLCGKTDNIVQMKGCGQYLCGDACDEEEEEEEEEVSQSDILPNNTIQVESVQEEEKETVKFNENIEYIEHTLESEFLFIEEPILDIQTIEMLKDFNELVTTHGFLLNILSFIMSIVRFFAPNNSD